MSSNEPPRDWWRHWASTEPGAVHRTRKPFRVRRGSQGGRPVGFDRETYKHRNTVERCFNRLKQWRGLAMRTDQHAHDYEAGLLLGAIVMWTPE